MRPALLLFFKISICTFLITYAPAICSQCYPPGIEGAMDCDLTVLYCLDFVWCETTDNPPNDPHTNWCGPNTQIDNPQYYQFIADDPMVTFDIYVALCSQGTEIQAGILEANCPWNNQDVIACEVSIPLESNVFLTAEVEPGKTYWLLIDGSDGAHCSYTFTSQGIQRPPVDGELDAEQTSVTPAIMCPGTSNVYFQTGPALDFATCYKWIFGWSTDTINSGNPGFSYDLAEDAPAGIWDVCVMAIFSSCDTSETVCTQIEILDDSDRFKTPETFCVEDFPFSWYGVEIDGPGEYHTTYVNDQGCEYDSIWIVDQYPEPEIFILDTVVCDYSLYYEGEPYDNPGVYFLEYPNGSINGCDSFAELHLRLEKAEIYIETIHSDSNSIITPQIIELIPPNNTFFYGWFTCGFDELLSTSRQFEIDTSGCYCLIMGSDFCKDTICSFYETTSQDSGCIIMPDTVCIGDPILISYAGGDTNATLHWLVELPDGDTIFFTDTDTISITNDFSDCYHISLTIVNDSTSITCRDSFCNDPNPLEGFICCDEIICDTCTNLIFSMNGLPPWTIIYVAGSVQDTLENVMSNPYEHSVCLPDGVNSMNYTFIGFSSAHDQCPGRVLGFRTVQHLRLVEPDTMVSSEDSLCVAPIYLSYSWHECDSIVVLSTNECYVPTEAGCYCVDILMDFGCLYTLCTDYVVGLQDQEPETGISIYPNPSAGKLHIRLNDQFTMPANWTLFDLQGIQLRHGMFTSTHSELLLDDISNGLYLLEIKNKNGESRTARIVIE